MNEHTVFTVFIHALLPWDACFLLYTGRKKAAGKRCFKSLPMLFLILFLQVSKRFKLKFNCLFLNMQVWKYPTPPLQDKIISSCYLVGVELVDIYSSFMIKGYQIQMFTCPVSRRERLWVGPPAHPACISERCPLLMEVQASSSLKSLSPRWSRHFQCRFSCGDGEISAERLSGPVPCVPLYCCCCWR